MLSEFLVDNWLPISITIIIIGSAALAITVGSSGFLRPVDVNVVLEPFPYQTVLDKNTHFGCGFKVDASFDSRIEGLFLYSAKLTFNRDRIRKVTNICVNPQYSACRKNHPENECAGITRFDMGGEGTNEIIVMIRFGFDTTKLTSGLTARAGFVFQPSQFVDEFDPAWPGEPNINHLIGTKLELHFYEPVPGDNTKAQKYIKVYPFQFYYKNSYDRTFGVIVNKQFWAFSGTITDMPT